MFTLRVSGEPGTWIGMVDAHTGKIHVLYDENKYAQVKGGVYPESDDLICPSGCEQPNFPMPFADIDLGGTPITTNAMGLFDCEPAGTVATTTLNGPYVRVNDNCGSISESVTCDDDLDMGLSPGNDCSVPPGSSPGNTPASRSSFYHLNRAKEHAMAWLPANTWLTNKLTDNVNINSNCNAYWNGSVNFYTSGGGCRNTGEIAGVVLHEWGHGFDQNDGGGYDNPSEAYADVSDFMYDHTSCIGRGFWVSQQCGGYGNPCVDCTGIRDQDWDMRVDHTPSTAAGFIMNNCGGGGGPCGKETHCEGYLGAETIWDLAARDFTAMGLDQATAWQLMDKLWFKSRAGSGDNAYNCSPPNSDGCGSYTWFTKLRNIDDDDGNLDNGTPHAAAIFAAFDRHNIACGSASDDSNQNYSNCPTIAGTTLSGSAGSNSASLSWDAVPDAAYYNILRNDIGCEHSFTLAATVNAPTTTFTDTDLANDFPEYYRVQAVGTNFACDGPVSNCIDITPQPFAGSIKMDRASYNCDWIITLSVRDANVGASTVETTIWSTTESSPETVILTETPPGSSKFIGTINTTSAAPASDGLLSVEHDDTITAEYIDADDGEGGHGLVRQTQAVTDCIGPAISNVASQDITDTVATIVWNTSELSDSLLTWGPDKPPTNETSSGTMVTSHSIQLTGLQECTVYYYKVSSSDDTLNTATDDNGGNYYHFETLRDDPEKGLVSCHAGQVYLNQEFYNCSQVVNMSVIDLDLDTDEGVAETINVTVTSTSESETEEILLTETGLSTGEFAGTIMTDPGEPIPDGMIQVKDGDAITVTYHDADDGAGSLAIAFEMSTADCIGPGFSNITFNDNPPFAFSISWNTSEPATSRLDYGTTPSLGQTKQSSTLKTSHSFTIQDFDLCETGYFKISGTDTHGNNLEDDNNGQLYAFETGRIPTAVLTDGFEKESGWSLDGEWEIGTPQGLGGSGGGNADPTSAYYAQKVLGLDLSGQGSYPGDYELNDYVEAISPEVDATNLLNGQLIIRRWLNVHYGMVDQAKIEVYDKGWNTVWQNPNTVNDGSWTQQSYDISAYADANRRLRIKFSLGSNGDINESGWNLDNVIIKDATAGSGEPCGDCTNLPSFYGLTAAADVDPCADTGVSLDWNAVVSWGSGGSGTYAIYRDTVPDFVPSSGNLVASGISATIYTDAAAPNDTDLYYLIRAENNETCSTGPNNGGVMDDNTVYILARDDTSQLVPGDVGSSVRLVKVNDVHIRLTWDAAVDAAYYRIYRADNAQMTGAVEIGSTGETYFDDETELANANDRYYKIKAVNSCGVEGL
jgi:fibronectin type 3 domain-containing protein